MDNQQGPAVKHVELHSMLWGRLDGRGVWGRMDTSICVWLSPFAVHLKLTTLLIGSTPIENKKLKK